MYRHRIDDCLQKVFGIDLKELLQIKEKLDVIGLNVSDIITFLDRDKVQLFAEQKHEIQYLTKELIKIKNIVNKYPKDE